VGCGEASTLSAVPADRVCETGKRQTPCAPQIRRVIALFKISCQLRADVPWFVINFPALREKFPDRFAYFQVPERKKTNARHAFRVSAGQRTRAWNT
jgi:hypothetical protein